MSGIIYQKSVTANELDLMFQYTKLHSANFSKSTKWAVNRLLKEAIADNYKLDQAAEIDAAGISDS